jgi:hypothetical protein
MEKGVYHIDEEVDSQPKETVTAGGMVIERGADFEGEEVIRGFELELSVKKEFVDKKNVLLKVMRRGRDPRSADSLKRYLYYGVVRELQTCEQRMDKIALLSIMRDALKDIHVEGLFQVTLMQSLLIMFELEKHIDTSILFAEVLSLMAKDNFFDNEFKYELVSAMHARLFHPDFRIKKYALSIIISLTKNFENEFNVVFENILEKCYDGENTDLVLLFLQILADLDFVVFSDKISHLIIEMIHNPVFSFSRDSMHFFLKFLEKIIVSFPALNHELAKGIFLFLCKNMRNLHKDIRREAIDVFCKLDLRGISESFVIQCIQKEKFEDYQKRKPNIQNTANQHHNNYLNNAKMRVLKGLEKQMENRIPDSVVIGCIHHVLEDELPEVRMAAIRALETLGRMVSSDKCGDIRELLLYFLNDDFDSVRIKALHALTALFQEITLSDFELETMYFNMKENVYQLRIAIYKLISNISPKRASQIVKILQKLTENIKLYREDAPWIYKTIKKIFEKNKKYQLEVLTELLFSDNANLIQEKDFKDPESVVRIILMSNALKYRAELLEKYPHYFRKQVILIKENYPSLIYDIDNEDSNDVQLIKNSVLGDETLRSFLRCLNEQLRGRENTKLARVLNQHFDSMSISDMHSKSLEMLSFADKLIGRIRKGKLELSSILPNKRKILDSIFKIALTKATLRITPNLKKFLNLAESCLWMQYLHYQIRSGQIKRSINVVKVNNIVNALYDAAMALSKDDNTNQYSRLCQSLQPLLNNLTHSMLLTNANLLSIFSNFMTEFNIQEFGFFADDFTNITVEKAFVHPKESEQEIIEVLPRYPFSFKIYIESESEVPSVYTRISTKPTL